MRYMVRRSFVDVVGKIWMPMIVCSLRIALSDYDIGNIKVEGDGEITRDAVEQWLTSHSGDFSSVLDFSASIEDGLESHDFQFATPEGESAYLDALSPDDDF